MSEKALAFLRDASDLTLEQYELNKRAEAANLTKQLRALIHQIIDELAEAEMARLWREQRKQLRKEGPAITVDVLHLGFDE